MKAFGYWLIILSAPFCAGVIDIDTMAFIGSHGGGMLFISAMLISAIFSLILVGYSIFSIIKFVKAESKEDYLPIIIYPLFLTLQLFVWVKYLNEYL